ncbi:hypothetical protein [Clostridium drakei]|uniref:Uncharacterized protein n=1 Tax=Clostridium drakei TaxID=332101 RepID=A0A2U8DXF2_9CLOT|nr:hypothetical protein [Clostridium drakei]AWI06732.1 hypothetical protein B9W14_20275 [Clostridium drakei]
MADTKISGESNIQLLNVDLKLLKNAEILAIANSMYTDENWSRLIFSLFYNKLKAYKDGELMNLVKKKQFNGLEEIEDTSYKCFFFNTSLRHPGLYEFIKEFKYYSNSSFFNGISIFSAEVTDELSFEFKLNALIPILFKNRVLSNNGDDRFIVVIYRDNNPKWEIAIGYKYTRYATSKDGTKLFACSSYLVVEFIDSSHFLMMIDKVLNMEEIKHEKYFIKL